MIPEDQHSILTCDVCMNRVSKEEDRDPRIMDFGLMAATMKDKETIAALRKQLESTRAELKTATTKLKEMGERMQEHEKNEAFLKRFASSVVMTLKAVFIILYSPQPCSGIGNSCYQPNVVSSLLDIEEIG